MKRDVIAKLKILMDCFTGYRTQILMYHNISDDLQDPWSVSQEEFAAQMDWLKKRGYSVLSLSQVLADFLAGKVRRKSIVLTFDDGYSDFLKNAVPVLKMYAFPAVLFVIAGETGGVSHWRMPGLQRPLLNWEEIREVVKLGHEIGSHGLHHRDLTSISPEDLKTEITVSKRLIENNIGTLVYAFSYPWGKYNARVKNTIQEAGYCCAVKVGSKLGNGPETNRFHLQRLTMCRSDSLADFARKVDRICL